MTDDLLDVIGDAALLGKNTGMDAEQHKMTWISLRGIEGTRQDAEEQIVLARKALEKLPWDHRFLDELADSIATRNQ